MNYNAVIGQSGGPTSVINASLCGVIEQLHKKGFVQKLYGMNFGIEGFMQEQFFDLFNQPQIILDRLKYTPSSALGSSRYKLSDEDLPLIKSILEKYNIRYFFLIGGNDTMDTIHRVEKYCRENGYELVGVGIPKTVDNDLFDTDHTPGFASAARYNILSVMQTAFLARDMQKVDKFSVYQTVGRDAGWLAAATAMAKVDDSVGPHLIYMPERTFDKDTFLGSVQECVRENGFCSIVCGEGITYADGSPVSATQSVDNFSNAEFGAMGGASVALRLHRMVRDEFGFRGEFQIPESLNMCAADRASQQDFDEAFNCGVQAVNFAEQDETGVMVTIERHSSVPYVISYGKTELKNVAVHAKPMPDKYIAESGDYVTDAYIDEYLAPLIGRLPEYASLIK